MGQISPYLEDIKGDVLDFGAGSGEVAQLLQDKHHLNISAVDLTPFKSAEVPTVPFLAYDGVRVPVPDLHFEAAVLTNVIHHEAHNEQILDELDRMVNRRLVIIETVPADDSTVERERTFVNDVLWNPVFNNPNIPFQEPTKGRKAG